MGCVFDRSILFDGRGCLEIDQPTLRMETSLKQMSSFGDLNAQLEALERRLETLRNQRRAAEAARGAGADPSMFDDEIQRVQREAEAIRDAIRNLGAPVGPEASTSRSKRKIGEEDVPPRLTRARTRKIAEAVAEEEERIRLAREQELGRYALQLTLAQHGLDAYRLERLGKTFSREVREFGFGSAPFASDELQLAFLRRAPTEARVLEYLFVRGTDLRANHNAALRFCAYMGYAECVKRLVALGVGSEASDTNDVNRAVQGAVINGKRDVAILLVKHFKLAEYNLLERAWEKNMYEVANEIWKHMGADARRSAISLYFVHDFRSADKTMQIVNHLDLSLDELRLVFLRALNESARYIDVIELLRFFFSKPEFTVEGIDAQIFLLAFVNQAYEQFFPRGLYTRYAAENLDIVQKLLEQPKFQVPFPLPIPTNIVYNVGNGYKWKNLTDAEWLTFSAREVNGRILLTREEFLEFLFYFKTKVNSANARMKVQGDLHM